MFNEILTNFMFDNNEIIIDGKKYTPKNPLYFKDPIGNQLWILNNSFYGSYGKNTKYFNL